jgi:glyoxylase-like metal-dependent hydrolase (beta-lactamase superfamily II)
MVTLVRASNPSPMTLSGTNSYLIDCGDGHALVIDPGPPIASHVDTLLEAARAQSLTIAAIAVTHWHPDHAPAAAPLAGMTGAPIYAHPASTIPHDRDLELERDLRIGQTVLRAIDAPGHTFDHVIFYLARERALFTGDVILGEGSVVIAPPGGAMRPYQRTLQRLADEFGEASVIYGGHGPIVTDAQAKIAEYIAHRRMREEQILAALAEGPQTIPELVLRIYGPTPNPLQPAMARQILAHVIALEDEGRVAAEPTGRAMSTSEDTMLNPRIEQIVAPEEAAIVTAELGSQLRIGALYRYRLIATVSGEVP